MLWCNNRSTALHFTILSFGDFCMNACGRDCNRSTRKQLTRVVLSEAIFSWFENIGLKKHSTWSIWDETWRTECSLTEQKLGVSKVVFFTEICKILYKINFDGLCLSNRWKILFDLTLLCSSYIFEKRKEFPRPDNIYQQHLHISA